MYATCVMSQFPKNMTLLLLNRCHVMHVEQPTTFPVPSWLELLGMVHGFVKAAPCCHKCCFFCMMLIGVIQGI